MNSIPQSLDSSGSPNRAPKLSRRAVIRSILASAGAAAFAANPAEQPDAPPGSAKRYLMKKSINLWAFPYPNRMSLKECFQLARKAGFDAVELNYDLDNDLSPKAGAEDLKAIRKTIDDAGLSISGLCSFLFWPYPLTSNDPAKRAHGLELALKMAQAAHDLGVENLLVVPGAVHIPWRDDYEPVPNDVCDRRAREAVGKLVGPAEKLKVYLNIENIFFSGYLMTPMELNAFVDSFGSEYVKVHFDTGNIALFQHAEHWIPILGQRIKNTHLKEFSKKGTDHSLESFRTLLDGTTNWPAVMDAFAKTGYQGYLTFEYFHPFQHYPEALIYQTSDALDRILGRKT
jgi:hexulose-6-phosphate isomerase